MRTYKSLIVAAVMMASGGMGTAQNKPNLSGTWKFVGSQSPQSTAGRPLSPRGGGSGAGTVVHTVSGAAANCKIECTIAQDDKSVTISLPADAKGMKPRDTLLLFAGEMEAVSSRPQTDAYRAKWEGDRLVVSNSVAFVSITQQLFIENGQLTIASKVNNPDGTTHSAVFVYARK